MDFFLNKNATIKGRVTTLNQFPTVLFGEFEYYELVTNKFTTQKFAFYKSSTKDYDRLCSDIFPGSCIVFNEYEFGEDLKGNVLLKVISCQVLGHKRTGPFPTRYKRNQVQSKQIAYKDRIFFLTTNEHGRQLINKKFKLLKFLRTYFESKNFTEVNIPVLETYFGGADAEPFTTTCKANKKQYFLRISFQYPLKGLLVAGFPSIFYIGSAFRNEGRDRTHSPEFLFIEAYSIHHDIDEFRTMTEELYQKFYHAANGTSSKHGFDLTTPWPIYSKESLDLRVQEGNYKTLDQLFRSKVLGPFFHVQGEYTPLAKDSSKRIESYCDYETELANYYPEQNDHLVLEQRSKTQEPAIAEEFIKNISYGMHDTVGWGLGIERLLMSCLNETQIRDVQQYPLY